MIPSPYATLLLAPGDRMELEEFLERWEQSPALEFAELIDGMVYMPSHITVPHGRNWGLAGAVLGSYTFRSDFCTSYSKPTWLMLGSAPQPDIALSLEPEYGGKMEIAPRDLASGLPELVVEICRSSRSYDLGPKLALYERAGVPEYLAILIEEKRFEWRISEQGRYRLLETSDGIFRSRILPGLWIDERAFWRRDRPRLLAAVDQGLQSPELLEFKRHKKP